MPLPDGAIPLVINRVDPIRVIDNGRIGMAVAEYETGLGQYRNGIDFFGNQRTFLPGTKPTVINKVG